MSAEIAEYFREDARRHALRLQVAEHRLRVHRADAHGQGVATEEDEAALMTLRWTLRTMDEEFARGEQATLEDVEAYRADVERLQAALADAQREFDLRMSALRAARTVAEICEVESSYPAEMAVLTSRTALEFYRRAMVLAVGGRAVAEVLRRTGDVSPDRLPALADELAAVEAEQAVVDGLLARAEVRQSADASSALTTQRDALAARQVGLRLQIGAARTAAIAAADRAARAALHRAVVAERRVFGGDRSDWAIATHERLHAAALSAVRAALAERGATGAGIVDTGCSECASLEFEAALARSAARRGDPT